MSQNQTYNVAIVGATGAVGEQLLNVLAERNFPIHDLRLLSSKRSAGTTLSFKDKEYIVQEAKPESFEQINVAFFSAGGSVSKKLAHEAVRRGAVVIDNTSAFRMDPNVPLIVPEVNASELKNHHGIIANPNCSTIQMVVALEPIRKQYGLSKVIVSTYQAVSGAGLEAVDELYEQTAAILQDKAMDPKILPVSSDEKHYQIAFNAIPQIDKFQENGYTFEEMKMINETKKIFGMPELEVAATCVRLPVETGHSESVYVEVKEGSPTVAEIRQLLENGDGVTVQDNPEEQIYPMPVQAVGKSDVFVGRIRKDLDRENGIHMWVVSDNLLKGAALNSVQIAESLIQQKLL